MNSQLKKSAVLAIFGENYTNKLIRLLTDCCQPHILIQACATCAGLNASGVQQYNITASATYNMNISGYTSLFGYFSNQPFPDWTNVTNATLDNFNLNSASVFVGNITAKVPVFKANFLVSTFSAGVYYGMVTDNRGNYAAPIPIIFPVCPNG